MTEQLTGYEASSVVEVGAVLDDSPADAEEVYLRTIGLSERAIAAVAAKRAGGGSSLPPELVVNAGRLEFDASINDPNLTIFALTSPSDDQPVIVEINSDGTPGDVQWSNGQNNIHEIGSGSIRLFGTFDGADNLQLYATTVFTGGTLFQIEQSKVIFKGVHTPPDDSDLASSSFGLWLDDTPGAAKLMVKAKDSGGTVRTAAIDLT